MNFIIVIFRSRVYNIYPGPVAHLARAFLWHRKGGGFESHRVHISQPWAINIVVVCYIRIVAAAVRFRHGPLQIIPYV